MLCCVVRLPYLETSAATGENVSRAVDMLLERVMQRMEAAVDQALLPGRGGRPRSSDSYDLQAAQRSACYC